MRRIDRACMDEEFFNDIFDRADTMYVAINGNDKIGGYPYIIPVNFVKYKNKLYVHAAHEGLKLDLISNDSRAAFTITVDIEVDIQDKTTYYKSICGTGRIHIVNDDKEKGLALDKIAEHYKASCPVPAPKRDIDRVTIIGIEIENITGKRNLKK